MAAAFSPRVLDRDDALRRGCPRAAHKEQVGVADDPREDVVEVMGHTAREGAMGLHLFRTASLSSRAFSPARCALLRGCPEWLLRMAFLPCQGDPAGADSMSTMSPSLRMSRIW